MNAKIITREERADRKAKWRGLGDVIASATRVIGIIPCGGCKRRQATLNRWVPFAPPANELVKPSTAK